MENTLQSWLDEILSNDNNAKTALEMMDVFALAKGIPGEVAAFLFGIRPAGSGTANTAGPAARSSAAPTPLSSRALREKATLTTWTRARSRSTPSSGRR